MYKGHAEIETGKQIVVATQINPVVAVEFPPPRVSKGFTRGLVDHLVHCVERAGNKRTAFGVGNPNVPNPAIHDSGQCYRVESQFSEMALVQIGRESCRERE